MPSLKISKHQFPPATYLLPNSILITLFLAYIDEGSYNFNWSYDGGSWVAVVLYTTIFHLFLYLIFSLTPRRIDIKIRLLIGGLLGSSIIIFSLSLLFN